MTAPVATITQAKYIARDAQLCPVCGSEDVEYGDLNTVTGVITQEMDCNGCQVEWYSMFRLEGYEPRHRTWPEPAWSFEHMPEQFPGGVCKDCGRDYGTDVPATCSDDCPSRG